MAKLYMNRYYQGSISDEDAKKIVELVDNTKIVYSLKNIITHFNAYDVKMAIDTVDSMYAHDLPITDWSISSLLGVEEKVGELSDAQTVGVAYMYLAKKCLLGDAVGLGKTVQFAGLIRLLRAVSSASFCFLTESTSVSEIRKKLMQFTGQYVFCMTSGDKNEVSRYIDFVNRYGKVDLVGPHSLLLSNEFQSLLLKAPFGVFCIDESGILANRGTASYKAAQVIISKHERHISLDATPFGVSSDNIYNQLNILERGYLPSKTEFDKTFCTFSRGQYTFRQRKGYKSASDEFLDLVKLRYFGRTRNEAGGVYEDSIFKVVEVKQSAVQKRLDKECSMHQMIADCPTTIDESIEFNVENCPKAGAVLDILKEYMSEDGRVIVYCRFLKAQALLKGLLEEHGYSVGVINGKDTKKIEDRMDVLDGVNSGDFNVLITNVQRGLDMGFCDIVIMYTIEPNPQKMVQLEGRVTRGLFVSGKTLFLLVSGGSELRKFNSVLRNRVKFGEVFSYSQGGLVHEAIKRGVEDEG